MGHSIAVLIALLQAVQHDHNYVALFTPLEYSYTGTEYQDRVFRYRLFVPTTTDPSDKKPLIVWLHGRGEAGEDNIAQLGLLFGFMFPPPWIRERYPFFLLAVQCPSDNSSWTRGETKTVDDMIDVAAAILKKTIRDYSVDADRIYAVGASSGGTGCWELAMRYPGLFAAVAPCSSTGAGTSKIEPLRNLPIWAFHNTGDSTSIEPVRRSVDALKKAGGYTRLTEFNAEGHDCWSAAFKDYCLLDWLLLQQRGHPSQPDSLSFKLRRFFKVWTWWQLIAQVAIPPLAIAAIWVAIKRCRRTLKSISRSTGYFKA